MRIAIAAAVACFIVTGLSAAQESSAAIKHYELNIPRQALDGALKDFAHQTGLQIARFSDTVDGSLEVGPVTGSLSAEQALTSLLSSRGLTYTVVNDRTIAVTSATNSATPSGPAGAATRPAAAPYQMADPESDKRSIKRSIWARFRLAQANPEQAPTDKPAEKPDTTSEGKRAPYLEEVIVTATKRAENVQDVPISIAVVSADDIDRRGLVGAGDYLRGIPGANQIEATPAQSIVLRGIEAHSVFQSFNGGERTGTYFGETPTTGSAGTAGANVDIKLVDIERVEVLRGPQGTAFGSSSMGGTVRTIPVAPKLDRFEGKVAVGYSDTSGIGSDNYNFQVVGNIPLVQDRLAVRATAYQYQDSGFYRNRAASDPVFQAAVVIPQGAEAFAVNDEEVGSHYVIGGRIAALLRATDDLRFTLTYLTQKSETDGIPVANSGSYEQSVLQVAPEHVHRGQGGGLTDTDIDIVNPVMEYDLGWADLLASYSYVKSGTVYMRPMTSIGALQSRSQGIDSPYHAHVGELRLASHFDGAWNFLAGLYAENNDTEFRWDGVWFGDQASPARSALPCCGRLLGVSLERFELKQRAAFGEASWKFLPGLTLTGGVRAFEYDRSKLTDQSGPFFGGSPAPTVRSAGESGTTFRANLSYEPGDDALLYAGWSQGFRAGGPLGQVPPAAVCPDDANGFLPGTTIRRESIGNIDSDAVDSYEIGSKFAFMERRFVIDAAIFHMDWVDMPVNVLVPGCFSFQLNAGTARSEGVELQANVQITDAFRVDFGGSYLDPRLTKDVPALGWNDGDRLPGSPEVNANLALQYEFDIGGHKAFVRADSIYVGPFFSQVVPNPASEAGDYVKVDATARMTIESLNIDLFVRNLANEDAYTFRSPFGAIQSFGYQMRPRTVGLQLGYTF